MDEGTTRVSGWGTAREAAEQKRIDERWRAARRLVRRSILIVPTNVPRFVEKAHQRGSDAVMLDLEDSIPDSEKADARGMLADAVGKVGRGGADVLVRINKPFDLAMADVDAAVLPGVATIAFPKTESAREVAILDNAVGRREASLGLPVGAIGLAVMIETAGGLRAVNEIVAAADRIVSVDVGAEDFTRDLDVEPTASGHELLFARQAVVMAARRAGVQAHGMATTLANYTDLAGLADSVRRAREMGFRGAGCIHPAQVPVLNEHFGTPPDRVARARKVLEVFDAAVAQGRASASIDGQMIDVPVAERARAIVERADAIDRFEARKRAALLAD